MPTTKAINHRAAVEYLRTIARKGGRSRSPAKLKAARANIQAYNARRRVRA